MPNFNSLNYFHQIFSSSQKQKRSTFFKTFLKNMSSSENNHHGFRQEAINDVAYSIGFSLAVLVVLMIISYISYRCNRSWSSDDTVGSSFSFPPAHSIIIPPQTGAGVGGGRGEGGGGGGGLDDSALVNYPKFLYSHVKMVKGDVEDPKCGATSGCSICLADYKDSDMLRLLPECGHLFHLGCIDPWLKLHPTCPICRSSPMVTPLAEVVPLSHHQN